MAGIRILEVRVEYFRSLRRVAVPLNDLTVLIGENNSGKTGFLEALHAAIGLGRRANIADDIYLGSGEVQAPRDRVALIDVLIRPFGDDGKLAESFPAKSPWLTLWGNGIAQDKNDNDFVGLRAQIKWNATKGEYEIERRFLTEWADDPAKMAESKINEKNRILTPHIEPLTLYLLDAKRDIQDELANRASFWGKLVSDLGLTAAKTTELEKELSDLNSEIVSNSGVLAHVQTHLDQLYKTLSCEKESVSITPLARHLRDFNRGLDINFKTNGSSYFPLSRHGMGTRSLAAVLAFRAYTTWRHKQGTPDSVHSMLGLEEPESHLHPQAQRALFNQLKEIPGQKIVSTHSPYVASQAEISSIRHFKKHGSDTIVTRIDTSGLDPEDIRKINRQVLNTRGELLYARAVVLFEGETEEQALPVLAQTYYGQHPHALGLTFIGVGGHKGYLPFLRLVEGFEIPWAILSDGETDAIKSLDTALAGVGIKDKSKIKNLAILPAGECYEKHLLTAGYEAEIIKGITTATGSATAVDDYIDALHGKKLKKDKTRDYKSAGGRQRAILDMMLGAKTEFAVPIAEAISRADVKRRIPPAAGYIFEHFALKFGWPAAK
jgi:putative ATP-dependent endonuclease of OLD family